MGDLYHLKDSFWFIPGKSTGSDVRYPSVVIARYILKNHGVTVGDEDDMKGSLDSGVGLGDVTFEDEVFYMDDCEIEDDMERRMVESLEALERKMIAFAEASERRTTEMIRNVEKRTAIRIANSRSSASEELAEVESAILMEMRLGRGVTVYEVESKLDTGATTSVLGSESLKKVVNGVSHNSSVVNGVSHNFSVVNGVSHNFLDAADNGVLHDYREAMADVRKLEDGI